MPAPGEPGGKRLAAKKQTRPSVCVRCGRVWTQPVERWRAILRHADAPTIAVFCPACARREFG